MFQLPSIKLLAALATPIAHGCRPLPEEIPDANRRSADLVLEGTMKFAISTALLLFLAGTTGYPQQQEQEKQRDKPRPNQQEQQPRQNPERATPPQERQQSERDRQQQERQQKPQQQQQQERPQRERQQREQDRARGQARDNERQNTEMQRRDREQSDRQQQQIERERAQQDRAAREHAVQQQQQAQRQEEERVRQERRDYGNRSGHRVLDEDFRTRFGPEHRFHVDRRDDRRFRYGGYRFVYTEPWPRDWDYNDDFYVDDIDGEYYLVDPVHPGYRLLVILQD
jgi:outer membrane biosynthesis protein TonB